METNGCLPWRPHQKNAVTFTVKCNLLFNMQQIEIKESWEWTPTESAYSTSDFFGRPRPFRNRSGPPELNCTTDQILRLRSEMGAGLGLCWVGQGRELVWHHVVSHSGSLPGKGRKLMLMNWTKGTRQALCGKRLQLRSKVNVNRLEGHQSSAVHFPDATNKGTHSLSVHYKMTTKAIPSFLLSDAKRYWQKPNRISLRLLWLSTLSKQDTI